MASQGAPTRPQLLGIWSGLGHRGPAWLPLQTPLWTLRCGDVLNHRGTLHWELS